MLFNNNYESQNGLVGGVKAEPVLKTAKTKNMEIQREISFLKALKEINL